MIAANEVTFLQLLAHGSYPLFSLSKNTDKEKITRKRPRCICTSPSDSTWWRRKSTQPLFLEFNSKRIHWKLIRHICFLKRNKQMKIHLWAISQCEKSFTDFIIYVSGLNSLSFSSYLMKRIWFLRVQIVPSRIYREYFNVNSWKELLIFRWNKKLKQYIRIFWIILKNLAIQV